MVRDNYYVAGEFSPASSATFSFTTSGAHRILFVGTNANSVSTTITGMTYNGVAMTQIPVGSTSMTGGASRTERLYLFYLINPDSGTHNVVVTASGDITHGFNPIAVSYSDDNSDFIVDITQKNVALGATSISNVATTTEDDMWAVSYVRNQSGTITDGSNYVGFNNNSIEMGDSNGSVGVAGSKTVTAGGPSGNMAMVTAFFGIVVSLDYQISGTVTLSATPVETATVRCIAQSTNTTVAEQTTDASGNYTFTGLDSAELYHLCVEYETGGTKYSAKSYWDIAPVEV